MDKRIVVATGNSNKLREIREIFNNMEICSMRDIGINVDVEEDGETFQDNAIKKAVEISRLTNDYVLSDDSGLCVDGLSGAPGVFSARFSPEGTDESNRKKLIAECKNLEEGARTARFVCVVALAKEGKLIHVAEGLSPEGHIIFEERGEGGFGYDPIFYVDEFGMTFSEMSSEQKNSVSHRYRALVALSDMMK